MNTPEAKWKDAPGLAPVYVFTWDGNLNETLRQIEEVSYLGRDSVSIGPNRTLVIYGANETRWRNVVVPLGSWFAIEGSCHAYGPYEDPEEYLWLSSSYSHSHSYGHNHNPASSYNHSYNPASSYDHSYNPAHQLAA
jgi:hypothetical protein